MDTALYAAVSLIEGAVTNVEQKLASASSLTREEKQGIVDALCQDLFRTLDNLQHVASSLEGIQVVRNQINELKESRA
jgi:hypothetical protein